MAHVLERLIAYAAQDAGFITQHIMCPHQAEQNYVMLEYKLQLLQSHLPLAEFFQQARLLEQWRNVGYPISGAPSGPNPFDPTVRQSLRNLRLSVKKSIAHRFPLGFEFLRPMYRSARAIASRTSRR